MDYSGWYVKIKGIFVCWGFCVFLEFVFRGSGDWLSVLDEDILFILDDVGGVWNDVYVMLLNIVVNVCW